MCPSAPASSLPGPHLIHSTPTSTSHPPSIELRTSLGSFQALFPQLLLFLNTHDGSGIGAIFRADLKQSKQSSAKFRMTERVSINSFNDNFYFVKFDWDREIIGRLTIKRNSNPFWSKGFKFLPHKKLQG
ncbi:hypothetical protein PTTG_02753 [Puccinia triticina 1-1 BBBD Race 1]|uniref:Uncharacterized protein n=1 Tax=Puccinia triticina (isolate 1-1 / race 1 (BBBD)) TaxID=630390 RepID=A0A0C4EPQ0_PUCT1|nr:hypothetical protein PTTG_02753 [Puccinia triticina 1-1 BBBD Race 1]